MQNILHIDNRKNIFISATAIIGVCTCFYIYFVTTTIRNIVVQKTLASQVSDMTQKISVKEFTVISSKNKITLEYAQSLGFADAKQKVFITPKSVSFVTSSGMVNTSAI